MQGLYLWYSCHCCCRHDTELLFQISFHVSSSLCFDKNWPLSDKNFSFSGRKHQTTFIFLRHYYLVFKNFLCFLYFWTLSCHIFFVFYCCNYCSCVCFTNILRFFQNVLFDSIISAVLDKTLLFQCKICVFVLLKNILAKNKRLKQFVFCKLVSALSFNSESKI